MNFLVYYKFPDHVDHCKVDVADIFVREVAGDLIQVVIELTDLLVRFVVYFYVGLLFDLFPRPYRILHNPEDVEEEAL